MREFLLCAGPYLIILAVLIPFLIWMSFTQKEVEKLAKPLHGQVRYSRDIGFFIVLPDDRVWFNPLSDPAPGELK